MAPTGRWRTGAKIFNREWTHRRSLGELPASLRAMPDEMEGGRE